MIFAVLDPSPLTVCINCSFFTFITYIFEYTVSELNSLSAECTISRAHPLCRNTARSFSQFDTILACDGTDRQTDTEP